MWTIYYLVNYVNYAVSPVLNCLTRFTSTDSDSLQNLSLLWGQSVKYDELPLHRGCLHLRPPVVYGYLCFSDLHVVIVTFIGRRETTSCERSRWFIQKTERRNGDSTVATFSSEINMFESFFPCPILMSCQVSNLL